jgi:hypothetical protein
MEFDGMDTLLHSFGLEVINNMPTKVTSHSSTLIDYVISNRTNKMIWCATLSSNLSDHYALNVELNFGGFQSSEPTFTTKCFYNTNSMNEFP